MAETVELLTVVLKCPECGAEQKFSSLDFESWVKCEKCGYSDEAWYFWHTIEHEPRGSSKPTEVWTIGAHYCNDALTLSKDEFLEYFYGGGKAWHGGDPYIWIRIFKRFDGSEFARADVIAYAYDIANASFSDVENLIRKFAKNRPLKPKTFPFWVKKWRSVWEL